jgi:hypothetical protein
MSYHDLSECTLSPAERREEANRICEMLAGTEADMTAASFEFFKKIKDPNVPVSVKQLFWLRDIKDRQL